MARSKYPTLNRINSQIQEITGVKPIDGLIGPDTERAVSKALAGYDGNDPLGYLADLPHKLVEKSPEIEISNEPVISNKGHDQNPIWLTVARAYRGLEEIVGAKHNPIILDMWKLCHLPFKDDETAWCSGFVGASFEKCGIRSTRSGMARSWLNWGVECELRLGCVVIFWRVAKDSPYGHVALCDVDPKIHSIDKYIPSLGGNQGNKVCTKGYHKSRLLGCRWPEGY